jgi:hypothetical protein
MMTTYRQNVQLDVGGLFQRAWNIFQADMVNWILVAVVGHLALGVGFWGGFHYCATKSLRGEKLQVGDVLYPFRQLSLLLPFVVIFAVAIVTCGLGALVLGFLWAWMYFLMVDKGQSFGDAAKTSKDAVMANMGATLLTLLVLLGLNLLGSMVAVGTFVATPFAMIFAALAYQAIFGEQPTPQQLDYAPAASGVPGGSPSYGAPPAAAPSPSWESAPAPTPRAQPEPPAPTPAPSDQSPLADTASGWDSDEAPSAGSGQPGGEANEGGTGRSRTIAMSAVDFEKIAGTRDTDA